MGGSGTSSTNQIDMPSATPMTRTWMATETGRVRAFFEPLWCLADSIRVSSNMINPPRLETPDSLGRFPGRRSGRHRFLTQFECLLAIFVRHRDVFLLLGRVRLDLRLLAIEEVDVGQGDEIVRSD